MFSRRSRGVGSAPSVMSTRVQSHDLPDTPRLLVVVTSPDGDALVRHLSDRMGSEDLLVTDPSEAERRLAIGQPVALRGVVIGPGVAPETIFAITDQAIVLGLTACLVSPLLNRVAGWLGTEKLGLRCVVVSPAAVHAGYRSAWLARSRDAVLSALALLVLSPLFGIVAALVKRSSPGPVFYAAHVIGHRGRPFTWYKFRSMRVAAPDDDGARAQRVQDYLNNRETGNADAPYKTVDNRRVTRIGALLRRHSLDELPQLWNVFRGQMSLVGPRPCLPYEYALYVPWQRERTRVKPGLTGVWQVLGRSQVPADETFAMDRVYEYVRSPWVDIRLIVGTVVVLFRGSGGA